MDRMSLELRLGAFQACLIIRAGNTTGFKKSTEISEKITDYSKNGVQKIE